MKRVSGVASRDGYPVTQALANPGAAQLDGAPRLAALLPEPPALHAQPVCRA